MADGSAGEARSGPDRVVGADGRLRPAILGWDMGTPLPRGTTVFGTALLGVICIGLWVVFRQEPHALHRQVIRAPAAFAAGGLVYNVGTWLSPDTDDSYGVPFGGRLEDFGVALFVAPIAYLILRYILWLCSFFYRYGRDLAAGGGPGSRLLGYAPTALLAGLGITSLRGYDLPAFREAGLFLCAVAIGGIALLGAGATRRTEGMSTRLRLGYAMVIVAPVLFWVLVHRRLA